MERIILEQCLREHLPIPSKIQGAPELFAGLDVYYVAFLDLHHGRPVGLAEGAIPWDQVQTYGRETGLTEDELDDLHYFVRELDTAYLDWRRKKDGKSGSLRGKDAPPRPSRRGKR
jgi:hypothetical protein